MLIIQTSMHNKINSKKIFITLIIISLVISALSGIFIFLFGSFDQIQSNILTTTFALALASTAGLVNISQYNKGKYKYFSYIGLFFISITFLMTVFLTWSQWYANILFIQWCITFIIISLSLTHISLLLLINFHTKVAKYSFFATSTFIFLVASIFIFLIFQTHQIDVNFIYRLLGICAILDVFGTIFTPVISKYYIPVIEQNVIINPSITS